MEINPTFLDLRNNYLFTEIANRTHAFEQAHPDIQVIKLGIGDVTRPLAPVVIEAMHKAVEDQAHFETFHGYGPEQGYLFLRRAVAQNDYQERGINIDEDEIFITEGAGSDLGNLSELFTEHNVCAIQDPSYPAYIDTSVMGGRAGRFCNGLWSDIVYLPCTQENHFCPELPERPVDLIYLCNPNNPTGEVMNKAELQRFVDYANRHGAIILYDAAYEAFLDPEYSSDKSDIFPRSIYELTGAKECAIEIKSFSKTAGFTGIRCGYTVVPKALIRRTQDGRKASLNQMWMRRQCTKYNGCSYISQRAAEATYTAEGKAQNQANVEYYRRNALYIRDILLDCEFGCRPNTRIHMPPAGRNAGRFSPYIWTKVQKGPQYKSWQLFDLFLNQYGIVLTPGVGFGPSGEYYIRFSAFGTHESTQMLSKRLFHPINEDYELTLQA